MRSATQADTAACQDADPEIFFPERCHDARAAKAVCARCPVASECLEYALKPRTPLSRGFGRHHPKERRRLQKPSQKRRRPPKLCHCGARAVAHDLCQLHYDRERRRRESV
jgi:WhiB family redox-sensing transcriptional regulator